MYDESDVVCANTLVIKGDQNDIIKLLQIIRSADAVIDFNKIIPCPSDAHHHDWNERNWGCFDNAKNSRLDYLTNDKATISFDTHLSPSVLVTKKMSEMFSFLEFLHSYDSEIMSLRGRQVYYHGFLEYIEEFKSDGYYWERSWIPDISTD